MNLPDSNDYIDIHTHYGVKAPPGVFSVISLMAHENNLPDDRPGITYSYGIHPWFLTAENHERLMNNVIRLASDSSVIAIGEAGFDKIKGAPADLQRRTFEEQVMVAEQHDKPVIIHCVRAWNELLLARKRLKPVRPWLVHGFRGNKDLAAQLLSKNMFLSFWFDFIVRPEATGLIRSLPGERIFLETDGSGVDIREIYSKVSRDLEITVAELKYKIYKNFNEFFNTGDQQMGRPV